MRRLLVTVQREADAEAAVGELLRRGVCGQRVTIVGIPPPLPLCAHWVGVTGVAQCDSLRGDLVEEVERVVRATVQALPLGIGVEHRVARCWREPRLLECLAGGELDEVLLVAEPSRRRDRGAVEAAARAGGIPLTRLERTETVVFAAPAPRPATRAGAPTPL